MKLYITPNSPYARMARIVVIEKGLEDRVEVIRAKTRTADSPYYAINPSGRVPYLVRDDGVGMEDSPLICDWLDHLDGHPTLQPPPGDGGWEMRRIDAKARSMVDGIAVWGREITYRPKEIRSQFILDHETERTRRLLDDFERDIDHPALAGELNMARITLVCAVHGRDRVSGLDWREGRPGLAAWIDRMGERRSVAETAPEL
jgi:glutathione S-transferase